MLIPDTWLGVSTFFDSFPALKLPIQLAGAVYLGYLGYQMLMSAIKRNDPKFASQEQSKLQSPFAEGFMIDILNPKMIVFYTSFYSQFLVTEYNMIQQFALLFSIQCLIGILIMAAYGYSAIRMAGNREDSRGGKLITIFSGLAMIVFSIATIAGSVANILAMYPMA